MGEATLETLPWMLVAGAAEHAHAHHPARPVLLAVARRGIPSIIEATIIPAALFFVIVTTVSAAAAMAVVLAWAYGAILRRVLRGDPVPAILKLATLGLTVRTLVGLVSGSTFAYFLQPVATTVVLAVVFFASVLVGRPVIAHLAHDFCPLAPDVASRPAIVRLFAGLTILWAGAHLLTAAITVGMLVSMSVPMFVAIKFFACLAVTVGAIVITVCWALRIARREHLVFATA